MGCYAAQICSLLLPTYAVLTSQKRENRNKRCFLPRSFLLHNTITTYNSLLLIVQKQYSFSSKRRWSCILMMKSLIHSITVFLRLDTISITQKLYHTSQLPFSIKSVLRFSQYDGFDSYYMWNRLHFLKLKICQKLHSVKHHHSYELNLLIVTVSVIYLTFILLHS